MANYNNIYKKFRSVEQVANRYTLSKRFDEPTYFSFRLKFADEKDHVYNIASNRALFDTMPHPLFDSNVETVSKTTNLIVSGVGLGTSTSQPIVLKEPISYSAVQYLIDANEPTRAQMLVEFIQKFNDLQDNFPYYFQQIDGISDLLKINPEKGQRIANDKKITITCLEGLDLRISYLLNLYRKIVWDDVYQRWVLPDMMRYFTLKIYLAEFRTFHIPQISEKPLKSGLGGYPAAGTEPVTATPAEGETNSGIPLFLSVLDDVLPTWEITCELCEFDITNISFTHLDGLNVGADPAQGAVKFSVNVGNIKELQIYPMFTHKFLSDRKLNGFNRAKDEISTLEEVNNKNLYPAYLQIAQDRDNDTPDNYHISGLPFNENKNSNTMYGQRGPGTDKIWGNKDDDTVLVNPTQPETWVGNAANFGKSYATGFIDKIVDKAKMTNIPGLGISFTEIKTAIESKNIISVLGTIRKGVNDVVNSYSNAPSSLLDQPIQTDKIMRAFLVELTKSEATDDDTKLMQGAANQALNDKGVWEQIKDFSLATNLVGTGTGEVNVQKVVYSTPITSNNTILPIQSSGMQGAQPNAVSGNIEGEPLNVGIASSQLSNQLTVDELNQLAASVNLSASTQGEKLAQIKASERLASSTQSTGLQNPSASSKLSSETQSQNIQTEKPNVRTTTIDLTKVIEAKPSSQLNKIEGTTLTQPTVSKATNSKLEK